MKLADMQLKHYHFNRILLEVNEEAEINGNNMHAAPYHEPDHEKLQISIVLGEPEAQAGKAEPFFMVTLTLEYHQPDFPYRFVIEVDGIFVVAESLEQTERLRHRLVVNAVSILYSSVRDQLLGLSARHKFGPMMLPCIDFRTIAPK